MTDKCCATVYTEEGAFRFLHEVTFSCRKSLNRINPNDLQQIVELTFASGMQFIPCKKTKQGVWRALV